MPKKNKSKLAKQVAFSDDRVYLSDISSNDKPWDKHRANADLVKHMYQKIGYEKYSHRIQECSRFLEFVLKQSVQEQVFKLNTTQFCRVRHCPVCQWRRAMRWRAKFFQVLPKILEQYPDGKFIFLTLTQEHRPVDELRETITWMNKSWLKLIKNKGFPGIGWVKSLEITKGKDGLAHPHFHIIIMVKSDYFRGSKYLSKNQWIALWKQALRVDYDPSIWITAIKTTGKSLDTAITKALCETLKYSVKESELINDSEWLKAITDQLHKIRSISSGGIFKKFLANEENDREKDLVHFGVNEGYILDSDPRFLFFWKEVVKRYQSI